MESGEVQLFAQAHMAEGGSPGLGAPFCLQLWVIQPERIQTQVWPSGKAFVSICFFRSVPPSRVETLHSKYAIMSQHSESRSSYHCGPREKCVTPGFWVLLLVSWVSVLNWRVWEELWSIGLSFVNLAKWESSVCLPLKHWATFLHIEKGKALDKGKAIVLERVVHLSDGERLQWNKLQACVLIRTFFLSLGTAYLTIHLYLTFFWC